ncbi:hypothetical protein PybrP1_003490 [[Pythium] brassicae (nom. inval.)]|nr:hypothetical protein PybrP1_003490 [[Pythium] brassicae (nom. inval.)]
MIGGAAALNAGATAADAETVLAHQLVDEQESYRRYQAAERDILDVLDAEELDDDTRKRRLMRVFDRFRYEYAQLSTLMREQIRAQRKIMDKCLEMKNALVLAAIKVKTNQQVQDEEMKNLVFYRDECEIAWKERKLSEERERDAMKIIDDLKSEIESLQGQVKALVATVLPPSEGRHRTAPHTGDGVKTTIAPRSATPSFEGLLEIEKRQEITRCVSVPSLQPTAMEKATMAVALLNLSPSPTRKSRKPPTAVGFMRAMTTPPSKRVGQSLPHV